ncbi:Tetratricopeptide-like helical [Penicillium odoratum]|uniref:Tetratricopeptide-like helical n=1 Tax=Penicillium odoratum TaxID=1167516 RepID=UPI00254760EB|nr:Tetratricopeptide-like helical [Penicillium odoratum]KAJ5752058.1 Tetratricopeptide-like helical [Penicillium odoratum]
MDPFSIVVGAAGLAEISVSVISYLNDIRKGSARINDEIAILTHEVKSLSDANDAVLNFWYSRPDSTSFDASLNSTSQDDISKSRINENWKKLRGLLEQSEHTIKSLRALLEEIIGKTGRSGGTKLDDLRKTIRKQDRDGEYMQIRARLTNNQQSISMFLSMLTLSYTLSRHAADDIVVGKISEDLQYQTNRLEGKISSLRSALKGSVDSNDFDEYIKSANQVAGLTKFNKHFYIPHSVSSYYTGRQKQLEELKATLNVLESRKRQDHQKRFVIYGLGGSGKTEFCCKFAQDNREHFWGIFWIDGSSYENAKHSYAEIAKNGGVEPNENAAKAWLSSLEYPWLLLIDNADDDEIDVTRYFPGGERGMILITTRNPFNRTHGTEGAGSFHFEKLEAEEASDLLLAAAVIHRPWEAATREYAHRAARILGYLPLALIHAGKAILQKLCPLSEYPEYYRRTWDTVRTTRSRSPSHGNENEHMSKISVWSTYEIIYVGLERKDSPQSRDALELLKTFSFFHWENIEFEFITSAALNPRREREDARARQRATIPALMQAKPKTWTKKFRGWAAAIVEKLTRPGVTLPALLRDDDDNPFSVDRLRDALSLLERLGLLTQHEENNSYWLHPLVHDWVRQRPETSTAEQAIWCQAAATMLAQSIFFQPPNGHAILNERLMKQIYPHVETVRKFQADLQADLKKNFEEAKGGPPSRCWPLSMPWFIPRPGFGRLQAIEYAKFSLVYLHCGYWAKAEELQVQVKDFVFSRLGADSEPGIRIALLLSTVYAIQTRNNEARILQYEVLESAKSLFGPKHPTTLQIMDTLGATCLLCTRLHEAHLLHQEAFENLAQLEGIGPDHELTWTALANLAKVKLRYFDNEGAIKLQSQVYEGFLKLLGPKHSKTLQAQIDLADIAGFMGEEHLEPSLKMSEEVVEIRMNTLGREHPLTLQAKLTMAKINIAMNNFKAAEELFREGLPAAERNLGENHLGTLAGRTWHGHLYWRQGRYSEAQAIWEDVMNKQRYENVKRADGEHSDRVQAMWFLVHCYEDQGRIDDALKMCEEVLHLVHDFGGQGLGRKHKMWQNLMEKKEELLTLKECISYSAADDESHTLWPHQQTHSSSGIPPKKVVKDFTF